MLRRRGRTLWRAAKPSFAGTGLLERMRSTSFALFGVTAAMALGLVALAAQQDWSVLPAAPIPAVPEPNRVGDAQVAAEQKVGAPVSPGASRQARPENVPGRAGEPPRASGTRLSGPRQLAIAAPPTDPGVGASPGREAPPAVPDPGPPPASPATPPPPAPEQAAAPAPATPATPSSSDSEAVAAGGTNGKGKDEIAREADVDDPKGENRDDSSGGDPDDRGTPPKYKPPRGGWKGSRPPKGGDPDVPVPAPSPAPVAEPDESADDGEYEDSDAGSEYDRDDSSSRGGRGPGHGRWGHGR